MNDCVWLLKVVILPLVLMAGCGRDLSGLRRSFTGEERCAASSAFDCDCLKMNAPEHQKITGVTILKCPFHDNYEAAIGHEGCLNKEPSTGDFRLKLSLDGCPWKESVEESSRLLGEAP